MSFLAKFRAGAVAAAVIGGLIGNPAFANSSANADIAAPLRAAQAAKQSALGSGDDEFRQLFASWRSMDGGNRFAAGAATRHALSIPSLMPVEGVHFTSGFGMRWHPVLGGHRQHKGVDLAAPIGTPIHAAADGVIGRADWFSSYGLYVAIEHGNSLETRYGHMSRLNVAAGQFVHKGDVIGYVGTTGRSTGPHLHYEVRIAGEAVNPVPYLEGTGTGEASGDTVRFADADTESGDE
ncbi:MAG: M23 family metallopeptidase [Sphingomonadales bacterium]|nr:M23 family metallopeptidase [Sphingomonadales bacterium]